MWRKVARVDVESKICEWSSMHSSQIKVPSLILKNILPFSNSLHLLQQTSDGKKPISHINLSSKTDFIR